MSFDFVGVVVLVFEDVDGVMDDVEMVVKVGGARGGAIERGILGVGLCFSVVVFMEDEGDVYVWWIWVVDFICVVLVDDVF